MVNRHDSSAGSPCFALQGVQINLLQTTHARRAFCMPLAKTSLGNVCWRSRRRFKRYTLRANGPLPGYRNRYGISEGAFELIDTFWRHLSIDCVLKRAVPANKTNQDSNPPALPFKS